MARKEIGTKWDRENRNNMNDNFKELYNTTNNFVEKVSDEAFDKVIDASKLVWKEPVDSQGDLPSSASEGDTIMARDSGKVYRFDGSEWIEIQQIDASAINEVDNRLTSQLAQKANEKDTHVYSPSPSAYWVAPEQPPARTDHDGYFIDGFRAGADYYLDNLWEPLRNEHSDYITRASMGKDTSGEYDVWRYDFTPKNYEKTILIIGTTHGGEVMGMLPFYRFMKEVSENWTRDGQLAYIRHKVRIISIPILNPWGLSQSPRTRQNSNGVDINRNFDYNWADGGSGTPGDHDYRGEAPFSENESQYIRDLLNQYPEATSLLDLHALGAGRESKAVIYIPQSANVANEIDWKSFFDWFVPEGEKYEFMYSHNGTMSTYSSIVHNKYASTPEWPSVAWSESPLDSDEITKSTEYFGNIIIMHSRYESKPKTISTFEPVTRSFNFSGSGNGTDIVVTSSSYVPIDEFTFEFNVPTSGILLFTGEITAVASNPDAINYFLPSIGQNNGFFNFGQNYGILYEKFYQGEYATLPLTGAYPVNGYNSGTEDSGKVQFQLKSRVTNGGEISIRRYHMQMTFIPSSRPDSVKMYSAEKGGQMSILYNGFKG